METEGQSDILNEKVLDALNHATCVLTKEYNISCEKTTIDGDYERLRALRRQSE